MQDYNGAETNSWLDMDMICFGQLYVVNDGGWQCKFTEDQKRTFMLQRALAASPLIAGGVLYTMDDFSISLMTHEEVLACNQNGVVGKLAHRDGKIDVWKTPHKNKSDSGWIGVFNRDAKNDMNISLGLKDMGLNPDIKYKIKDSWNESSLA